MLKSTSGIVCKLLDAEVSIRSNLSAKPSAPRDGQICDFGEMGMWYVLKLMPHVMVGCNIAHHLACHWGCGWHVIGANVACVYTYVYIYIYICIYIYTHTCIQTYTIVHVLMYINI